MFYFSRSDKSELCFSSPLVYLIYFLSCPHLSACLINWFDYFQNDVAAAQWAAKLTGPNHFPVFWLPQWKLCKVTQHLKDEPTYDLTEFNFSLNTLTFLGLMISSIEVEVPTVLHPVPALLQVHCHMTWLIITADLSELIVYSCIITYKTQLFVMILSAELFNLWNTVVS